MANEPSVTPSTAPSTVAHPNVSGTRLRISFYAMRTFNKVRMLLTIIIAGSSLCFPRVFSAHLEVQGCLRVCKVRGFIFLA